MQILDPVNANGASNILHDAEFLKRVMNTLHSASIASVKSLEIGFLRIYLGKFGAEKRLGICSIR